MDWCALLVWLCCSKVAQIKKASTLCHELHANSLFMYKKGNQLLRQCWLLKEYCALKAWWDHTVSTTALILPSMACNCVLLYKVGALKK